MTDKTLERINEEADKYGFRVPYDGSNDFYDHSAVKGYLAGAISERNKVLDDAISDIESYCLKWKRRLPSDLEADLIKILESLKL